MSTLISIGFTGITMASPPFQVLQTCINMKPYNEKITINRLEGDGVADKSLPGCQEQYDRILNGHAFGTLNCNDKFYFIINDKKIDPELSHNMSINPEIKPGIEFTNRALWYKINQDNNHYLCIRAPLAEHGIGATFEQYYIVENAFDLNSTPEIYFYFLDKDVVPITSKTL